MNQFIEDHFHFFCGNNDGEVECEIGWGCLLILVLLIAGAIILL